MKKCNLILGLVGSLFLISCGSSGGNNSNPSHSDVAGYYISTVLKMLQDPSNITITGDTANQKKLVVDGRELYVSLPSGTSTETMYKENISGKFKVFSGTHYKHSTFGLVTDNGKVYAYSQGNKTKEMPTTTDILFYGGDAVIGMVEKRSGKLQYGIWESMLAVDFKNKQLIGEVFTTDDTFGIISIPINAEIKGNKFAGKSKEYITAGDGKKFKTQTEGGFYGPKAKEMSGVFKEINRNEFSGSFGAVKEE